MKQTIKFQVTKPSASAIVKRKKELRKLQEIEKKQLMAEDTNLSTPESSPPSISLPPSESLLSSPEQSDIYEFFFGGHDKGEWRQSLISLINGSPKQFRISLEFDLTHQFSNSQGQCRYPSDQFLCILRDSCSAIYEERINGEQTFVCSKK